ncbi:MAG TPA: hypothetical protein VGO64_02670, partial [Candidatus Limnocylindrales bacterium]|nr:hypothetical protein [Candidatus Limnocylindrales bacterium]
MYDAPRAARPVQPLEPRTSPSAAGWLALVIFGALAAVALVAAVGTVAAFSRLTDGLPPVNQFDKITFLQQSIVYDRTGKIELARFGSEQRDVVDFKDIPPIVLDAQTAVEDKTFWENS